MALVYDPMTRDERLRRAELDVLGAASVVATCRARGQLAVVHLDELEAAALALQSVWHAHILQLPDDLDPGGSPALAAPPGILADGRGSTRGDNDTPDTRQLPHGAASYP